LKWFQRACARYSISSAWVSKLPAASWCSSGFQTWVRAASTRVISASPFLPRRQRAFVRMWFARLFGTTGNQMLMVAVGWQMYDLTHSAWDLGLVGLYQFVPALVLTLVAGHVADRVHRGRIVAACMATQGIAAAVLVLATQESWASRELLLLVSVALGAARAFQMPAQQALTPVLVPPAMLPRAMALSSAGMQTAIIGGPALGGVIFVAGASAVYATCAVLFAIGGVLVGGLRYDHSPAPREPVTMKSLLAGVSFIWQRKPVLGAVSLDLFAVLLGGATALLPMYAKDILHTGPWGLGLLRAAPAVGALLTSVVLTRWPLERRVGRTLLLAGASAPRRCRHRTARSRTAACRTAAGCRGGGREAAVQHHLHQVRRGRQRHGAVAGQRADRRPAALALVAVALRAVLAVQLAAAATRVLAAGTCAGRRRCRSAAGLQVGGHRADRPPAQVLRAVLHHLGHRAEHRAAGDTPVRSRRRCPRRPVAPRRPRAARSARARTSSASGSGRPDRSNTSLLAPSALRACGRRAVAQALHQVGAAVPLRPPARVGFAPGAGPEVQRAPDGQRGLRAVGPAQLVRRVGRAHRTGRLRRYANIASASARVTSV
jgi:MFS family permease